MTESRCCCLPFDHRSKGTWVDEELSGPMAIGCVLRAAGSHSNLYTRLGITKSPS